MSVEWQPAMIAVISEIMETMFFVSLDFASQDFAQTGHYCESKIMLRNESRQVAIILRVAETFARMVAANFLGLEGEEEVTDGDLEDVMREVANMVGGNYMSRMGENGWQLGIPSYHAPGGLGGGMRSGVLLSYLGEDVGVVFCQSSALSGTLSSERRGVETWGHQRSGH